MYISCKEVLIVNDTNLKCFSDEATAPYEENEHTINDIDEIIINKITKKYDLDTNDTDN